MEKNINKDKKTILIVDDEKPIVDILVYNLKKEGYNTLEANDGLTAVELAFDKKPDLILLDIMLPKMDGLAVCKKIRNSLNIPILMLTAKSEEIDKIFGLELGADEYITKPFGVRELMARIKANLRKVDMLGKNLYNNDIDKKEENKTEKVKYEYDKEANKITIGNLVLDLNTNEARLDNQKIDITVRGFEVLKYIALRPGQVITREKLLKDVWGYDYIGDERTVDVTIRRIRERIEKNPSTPQILLTKRGLGYYIAYN